MREKICERRRLERVLLREEQGTRAPASPCGSGKMWGSESRLYWSELVARRTASDDPFSDMLYLKLAKGSRFAMNRGPAREVYIPMAIQVILCNCYNASDHIRMIPSAVKACNPDVIRQWCCPDANYPLFRSIGNHDKDEQRKRNRSKSSFPRISIQFF